VSEVLDQTWTLGPNGKFLDRSRVNCRQHFFVVRVVKVWNNLPADVVCANSVSVFVHKLSVIVLDSSDGC